MAKRVAINGFGRIGRMVFRAGYKDKKINFVALNDLTDTKTLAHLLKYDSVHGKFKGKVEYDDQHLIVDGKKIPVFAEKDPKNLPWKKMKVQVVVESTGFFREKKSAGKHCEAGAGRVLLSAPGRGDVPIKAFVLGVNSAECRESKDEIISNASCTTNCLSPMVDVLVKNFGVERGFLNTVHGYTADQKLVDAPHKDVRRGRNAATNIIPTTTGAAQAVGMVIPDLAGKMDGIAIRAPVPDGSLTCFVALLKRDVTVEEVNEAFEKAANGYLKGILEYTEDQLVSSDVIGNSHSAVFQADLTRVVGGNLVQVSGWYDNEWGYSVRMIEMIKEM